VLGILHGTLLYAGDILTVYAVAGLVVLGVARLPLRRLLKLWAVVAMLALSVVAMNVTLLLTDAVGDLHSGAGEGYASATGMGDFLRLNAAGYLGALPAALLFFLPEVLLLVLGGFIAGRLRWLTHARWEPLRRRLWRPLLPVALLLNLCYAIFLAWAASKESPLQWVGLSAGPPAGWLLAAAAAHAAASWWHAQRPVWLQLLGPLGRYTLSVYVGHSLLCALFFSGAGLGWAAGTRELLAWGLGWWLACGWLAHGAARRRLRGPLEGWVARA
jgi:uncharacterized protein